MNRDPHQLLTLPRAAVLAGVSRFTIARAIEAGKLPAVDIGSGQLRHLRVTPEDLDAYLKARRDS